MTVQTPEPGPAPDFTVKENGLDTNVTLADAGAAAAIAVAIDTSNSMAGQKIADAKAAAARFVAGRSRPGTRSRVYGFGAKPYVGTAFPANPVTAATAPRPARHRRRSRHGDLRRRPDGVGGPREAAAAKQRADRPLRRRVRRTTPATLAEATAAAKAAHATIYAVSIGGNRRRPSRSSAS